MTRRVGFGTTEKRSPERSGGGPARIRSAGPWGSRRISPAEGQAAPGPHPRERRGIGRLFARLLFLASLGATFAGIWLLIDTVRFMGVAERTVDSVVSVKIDSSGDDPTYRPTIRFMTWEGEMREARTHIASSAYDYRVGEDVAILYDVTNPDDVRVNGFMSLWGLPLVILAIGSVGVMVMSTAIRRGRRNGTGLDAR